MHGLIEKVFDYIFPPSEEAFLVRKITESQLKNLYTPFETQGILALSRFSNPVVRALIHEAKFNHNKTAQRALAQIFDLFLETHGKNYTHIIPIPLSLKRMRERGYNQVAEVLDLTHCAPHIASKILIRARDTKPQTLLSKQERIPNVVGAFLVSNHTDIKNAHILLIDDVSTTGATLRAGKEALIKHEPASITCLAFAH